MHTSGDESQWRTLYHIGAASALLLLLVLISMIAVMIVLGPAPDGVEETFRIMGENRLSGFLRDDFLTLWLIVPYLGLAPALYMALRRVNAGWALFSTLACLVVVAGAAATNSAFSMLHLSDQYALATTEAARAQLIAAGEAVLATNMWNSSAGYVAGILLQGAGVIYSIMMLRDKRFFRLTAISGLGANALDLIQHLIHPFAPALSATIIMFAGPFYLLWFPLLAWNLFHLGRRQPVERESLKVATA